MWEEEDLLPSKDISCPSNKASCCSVETVMIGSLAVLRQRLLEGKGAFLGLIDSRRDITS